MQSRFVGLLMSILSSSFLGDIPAKISEFERKSKEYEQQLSQSIADDVKYGVLIMGVTNLQVKQHFLRNAQRLDSWGKARDRLLEISRTLNTEVSSGNPSTDGIRSCNMEDW